MKKKKHLFTVLLLAISLLSTSIPVYAQGNGNADNENSTNEESFEEADRNLMKDLLPGDLDLVELSNKELEDYEIPEVISAKDIKEKEHANRLFAQETDDYSIVYQNKDGSKTMYYFDEPVKYTDENGTVCDKSTKLSESDKDGYAFVSADNNINVYMPEQLDNETGIIVKSGEYTIEMSPVDSDKADVSDIITETENKYDEHDIVEYTDVFGVDTTIEYSAQLNGVKENIILDRYNGKNEFSFDVDTNGLVLREEDGYFSIVDDEINEVVGTVSEVILFDSANGENTIVPQGYVTGYTAVQNDDGRYTITITLDNEWLKNEAVYPVTIDPTITINSTGSGSSKSIIDTPIYNGSGATGTAGANSLVVIGYVDSSYGSGRHLMRFPKLMNQSFMNSDYTVSSATLTMTECSGNSATSAIHAYNYTGPNWNETTKYSSSVYNGIGSSISSCSFSYPNYTTRSYNITSAVKSWQTSVSQGTKGIIFKNATSESDYSKAKTFYTTESSTKPYLSVTYSYNGVARNSFYSKYEPTKFNNTGDSPSNGSQTELVQYRMNCYGYAFCNILNGAVTIHSNMGYKQQPGEFASKADKSKVKKFVTNNPSLAMNNIVSNMKLDANRLGYSIKEYTPTSSTVAQFGSRSRLIAVVTGNSDYHYYMQHSDGSWSHKPGSSKVTNYSLESKVKLTNSNIRAKANEGIYANGLLKFFEITKSAVIDHPHSAQQKDVENTLYYLDKAGDYIQTSVTKSLGNTSARIDFADDHDVYSFIVPYSKVYTIKTTCSTNSDLDCIVRNANGSIITKLTSTGQVDTTMNLTKGKRYYFEIYNYSKKVTKYTFTIS